MNFVLLFGTVRVVYFALKLEITIFGGWFWFTIFFCELVDTNFWWFQIFFFSFSIDSIPKKIITISSFFSYIPLARSLSLSLFFYLPPPCSLTHRTKRHFSEQRDAEHKVATKNLVVSRPLTSELQIKSLALRSALAMAFKL